MSKHTPVRVCGLHKVLGHQPGTEFDATDMPGEQLDRMLARGSVERVKRSEVSGEPSERKSESRSGHGPSSQQPES